MKRIAIINPDAEDIILKNLKKLDIDPVKITRTSLIAKPLAGHPDLQVFVHNNKIFCHPGISKSFIKKIETNFEVSICSTELFQKYPLDIPYNVAYTGKYAFHRFKYTAAEIKKHLKINNAMIIDVKQGYSKCSTSIIDENHIITSDKSINNCALSNCINSLLINSGYISLKGFEYGFIGGASGIIDNMVLFTGSINHHPDYRKIIDFIEESGKKIVILSNQKIIDLGSLLISG